MNPSEHPLTDPFRAQRITAVPMQPILDPAGWTADELASNNDWLIQLSAGDIAEIDAAVKSINKPDLNLMTIGKEQFTLPTLSPRLKLMRQQLAYGMGVVLIRGLPVESLGKEGTSIAFWGISQHLGDGVWSQNKRGHVLGHVTDLGETKSNPNQRGPYSREGIPFHVDCADLVGLLCLEEPLSGGASSIVSAVTIHNLVEQQRPDLLSVLYAPYYRDRRDEIPLNMQPWYRLAVFHCHQGYFSASIEPTYMSSPQRFDEVPDMSDVQREALAFVQQLAVEHCYHMGFKRGDMQFLNNHVVFHSRQAYADSPDPERKRHLLRIWLKLLDGRPLPDAFYERHGTRATVERPGGIVGPDTVLNAPIRRV